MVFERKEDKSAMQNQFEFFGKLETFEFNHWQYHIPIPEAISSSLLAKNQRRILVWISNQGPYPMGLMKAKEYWYILINQKLRADLMLQEGKDIQVRLSPDESEFGHEMPEELQVLLDQDEEGNSYFRSLTMGKQRSLVYLVSKVKNPESRLKKSLAIVHHLKSSHGKLDFRQLNQVIKQFNSI